MELPDQIIDRVAAALGKRPIASRSIERGYTNAIRSILSFAEGTSCFLKRRRMKPRRGGCAQSTTASTHD
jgi:hypothetical protein